MGLTDLEDLVAGLTTSLEATEGLIFAIWFLLGAALVFFMQCGFAMVESGLTRAKNAGNIIMKNLMDFAIGTVVFMTLGFGLMMGADYVAGIFGVPNLDIFFRLNDPEIASSFVFNLVFAATAATIVSGAMAERTKFSAYCIYSLIISAVIYPIEAGWVWNSAGWLVGLDFVDFAGSAAIHMVGGITACVGALFLKPRLGKYRKQKDGTIKSVAIPGHNLAIAALGVFILWFGWYGFNGAAATSIEQLARIFVNTTIAPAVACVATMAFTWIKNKKPDVSMTLNGALAGLVAITAGCSDVDALGATVIGLIAGIVVVVAVEVIDLKLHIDDPVGAVSVHGVCGILGTLMVGLFSTSTGLFYGGGLRQFGVQLLGVIAIAAWVIATMTLVFFLIKKFHGLRVSKEDEIKGLDITEHGLVSAYAGFSTSFEDLYDGIDIDIPDGKVHIDTAVPVQVKTAKSVASDVKISKVEIICKETKFEALKEAMNKIGVMGMTITKVLGCGAQKGKTEKYRGADVEMTLLPKIQVEIVVCKVPVKTVVDTAKKVLYTGHIGDGKIFVYDVENVIRVRTGEEGYDALQDEV
ncbi:MAG: ammonium transporter [Clostridiales bacterium]|jgi:Amt family ammonium transporter|nr:ammonium transporter [Clostridiales bacterium]